MIDDVPAQITLYPPTTDVETGLWSLLAPTLWHSGLIWHDYEMAVFDLTPVELRIWCTFTDRHAFQSWRHDQLVAERCAEILASKIDVTETITPWSRHDSLCTCERSTGLVLNGHGFGNRKSVLFCCDCLGYYPNYRVLELLGDAYAQLQSWALVSGHVYDIWMLTANLERWALRELQSVHSELNSTGRELAEQVRVRTERQVWYFLFVEHDARTNICPSCHRICEHPKWCPKIFACHECEVVY